MATERAGSLSDEQETCSPSSSSSGGFRSYSCNEGGEKKSGKCKWFNVAKGWGFITPDDGSQEVFVHQSVIQMNGFRSLGDEERVEYEWRESDKGLEATVVTGPEGSECSGSHRRPSSNKKKVKKIRCYNCGDLAHHIASKCNLSPQPKRCHNCKSEDHLIADCPKRKSPSSSDEKNLHHDKDLLSSTDEMQSENSSIDLNINVSAGSPDPDGSNGSTGE